MYSRLDGRGWCRSACAQFVWIASLYMLVFTLLLFYSGGVWRVSSGTGQHKITLHSLEANLRQRAIFAQTLPLALAGALRPSVRVLRVVRVLLHVNFLSFQSWG